VNHGENAQTQHHPIISINPEIRMTNSQLLRAFMDRVWTPGHADAVDDRDTCTQNIGDQLATVHKTYAPVRARNKPDSGSALSN
jgi:hypothetical protein